ncbi:TetR/AcrR family transcriptional regulator [Alkalimarinus sediminis]|uniref:TetR/AcrR family transcriptional regulator n=1 Tax=Alkalimarinus sediminis TaxID=1632866 RepID=A0A9E8HKA5_9ALTE|nr:TetR/AcrR family transcriptional regulator [Alkalimarinus sediminis]UZW74341.1 TetR/AcrR family transcriptional regulator [Alkalimarinus sediminis]
MPRPRRSEHTRDALIENGIEQLSLHGYHGTGIKQILDAVNVPKGSFYNYFASKEAFVAEILREYSNQYLKILDDYVDSSNELPLDKIKTIYTFMLEKFSRQKCQQGCLVGSIAAEIGNQSEACQAAMLESVALSKQRVSQLIQLAQDKQQIRDDLTAEQITNVFWSTWEGSLLEMKMEGSIDTARETLYLMLDHLLKPITRNENVGNI